MRHQILVSFFALIGLSLGADRYVDLCRQAASLSQQGKYEAAIEKYQAALAVRPGAPEALNNLAVMYYEVHKYLQAFQVASKLWEKHPEMKSAALVTGMSAVQLNQPQKALEPLQRLLASDPDNRDAVLALASAHIALGHLPEAAGIYASRTERAATDSDAWYGLAICYEQMAEESSRKLSQMAGGARYSKKLVGEFLQSLGDDKLAAEAFGQSESAGGVDSPEAARLYERARDWAGQSRKAFETFVGLAPNSWQAALFLGDVKRQSGDMNGALANYQKAAALQPNIAAPLLGMGTVYWELGQFDQASTYLKEALRLNPNATQAIFELGNIAVRLHQDEAAIPLLTRYLAIQPDALAARADLGRSYMHLAQYEKAVSELTKAAASDEQGEIHYQLSVALRKLGRRDEADAALLQSKQIKAAELARQQKLHAAH